MEEGDGEREGRRREKKVVAPSIHLKKKREMKKEEKEIMYLRFSSDRRHPILPDIYQL